MEEPLKRKRRLSARLPIIRTLRNLIAYGKAPREDRFGSSLRTCANPYLAGLESVSLFKYLLSMLEKDKSILIRVKLHILGSWRHMAQRKNTLFYF